MNNAGGLVALIDMVRDINKTISMHIDNHNNKEVDDMCMRVSEKVSKKLRSLERKLK